MRKLQRFIPVVLLCLLALTVLQQPPSSAQDHSGRDLVLVDIGNQEQLEQSGLKVIWKGATFFLAEWDSEQMDKARSSGIAFRLLLGNLKSSQPLYLVELHEGQPPPSSWEAGSILLHEGRHLILAPTADVAPTLMNEDYHLVLIPRVQRDFEPAAPSAVFDCSYKPIVESLLDRTSQAQWLDWIEKLSGLEPISSGGTSHQFQTRHSPSLFSGASLAKGYDFALQQLQSWHYGPAQIEEDPFNPPAISSYNGQTWKNIVLTIPGQTSPNQVVLLTAHLDSINYPTLVTPSPGADDNGSGSATMFEAARLFRQFRFARTIKIIWFTGEEQGLFGSAAYVNDHPVTNFQGVVNLDMFGYDSNADRCMEIHVGTLPQSLDVGNCFDASITAYNLGLSRDFLTVGATDRSDHASFWQVNVGAIEIAENFFNDGQSGGCVGVDTNPNYHKATDTMNNMALPYAFDIARGGLATVAAMAMPIEACFSSAPALSAGAGVSSVDLSWTPISGASRYRVYRSTQGCQGQWFEIADTTATTRLDAGAVEPRTYQYYVEAVDSDGFCVSSMSNCAQAVPTVRHASTLGNSVVDLCLTGGAGSGDGIIDPGESVVLPVTLNNDGNTGVTAMTGALASAIPGIAVTDPYGTWPDLSPGGSAGSNPDHFSLHVAQSTACGTELGAALSLSYAEGGNTSAVPLRLGATNAVTVLNVPFSAGIPGGWSVVDGGAGGGAAATWTTANPGARSIPAPFAAPFAIVDSLAAGAGVVQSEQLITPPIDTSGCVRVVLEFSNQFRWWHAGLSENAEVDVSTNGGSSWSNVLSMRGASDGYSTPNTKTVDITAASAGDPSNVQVRFHYYNGRNDQWWAVDNVKLYCHAPVCNPCAASGGAPGEAGVSSPLTVLLNGGNLVFDWGAPDVSCSPLAYALYKGDLHELQSGGYNHDTVLACANTGTSFSIPESDPRIGAADYYLVVAGNGAEEGSYGRNSSGAERPLSNASCQGAQNLGSCGP